MFYYYIPNYNTSFLKGCTEYLAGIQYVLWNHLYICSSNPTWFARRDNPQLWTYLHSFLCSSAAFDIIGLFLLKILFLDFCDQPSFDSPSYFIYFMILSMILIFPNSTCKCYLNYFIWLLSFLFPLNFRWQSQPYFCLFSLLRHLYRWHSNF